MAYYKPAFERPKGMKITDMCIFVDKNFPILMEHPDAQLENQIVKYLYFITDSLAKKSHYFPRFEDYDEFSLFVASELFCNMRERWNRKGEQVRGKEIEPIKSILNYIKTVLYPYKVQFQQTMYSYVINDLKNPDELTEKMREEVRQQYREDLDTYIANLIKDIPNRVHHMFNKISPYKRDKVMMQNIYISAMLTFIDNITLNNKTRNKLKRSLQNKDTRKIVDTHIKIKDNVILWHLPPHMEGYIRILVYRIKKIISTELKSYRTPTDLTDEVVDTIRKTAFTTYDSDQEEI